MHKIFNKLWVRIKYRLLLKKIGDHFKLGEYSTILKPKNVEIGDHFFSGPNLYISTNKYNPIVIGNYVMFGPEVMILGGNHNYSYTSNHMCFCHQEDHCKSNITIEDGAWIGARTLILSGAEIGEGSVIGAMSLVNNKIPPYTIAVGVPARKTKRRFENKDDLIELLNNINSRYSFDDINAIYKRFNIEY